MKLLLFLCLFFLIMPLKAEISEDVVFEQLLSFHGPRWGKLIQHEEDELKIKGILVNIINNDSEKFKNSGKRDQEKILKGALIEFGHFVQMDEKHHWDNRDNELVQKVLDDPREIKFKNLVLTSMLKNTNSPTGVKYMSDIFDQSEVISEKYEIIKALNEMIFKTGISTYSGPKTDFSMEGLYKPHISDYRKLNSQWKNELKAINQKIKKFASNNSSKFKFNGMLTRINDYLEKVEKKVKLDQNKVSLQKKDIKEDQDKVKEKEVREPASAEITDKNEEESSNTKLYVFLIIILAFFTYLFIGRVRD